MRIEVRIEGCGRELACSSLQGQKGKKTYRSWEVSQLPAPIPPEVDQYEHEGGDR